MRRSVQCLKIVLMVWLKWEISICILISTYAQISCEKVMETSDTGKVLKEYFLQSLSLTVYVYPPKNQNFKGLQNLIK